MDTNTHNEVLYFDCNRGCTTSSDPASGEVSVGYRQGCCKLKDYDWLHGVAQAEYNGYFEVRFKNTRKGI